MILDTIALIVAIIGGLNWGAVGLFHFDAIAWVFGGDATTGARVVYVLAGAAALWCISLLFRSRDEADEEA